LAFGGITVVSRVVIAHGKKQGYVRIDRQVQNVGLQPVVLRKTEIIDTEFLLPEVLNGGQFFGHKLEFGAFEPLFEDFTGRFSPAIQCRRTVFVKSILAPKKKGVVRGCGQQYV
jgi:hypothetical protein